MCAGLERTADRGRLLPYRGSDTIGRASPVHRKRSPRFALKNVTAFHKSDPQIGQILLQEPAQKRTFCLQKIPHMQRACAFEAQHDATKNKCDCLTSENGTLRYTPAGNGPNSRQYPKSVSLYYCVKTDWLPASLFPGQLRGAQEHAGEDVLPARGGGAPDAQGLHAKAGVLALAAGACGRPCSTILTTRVTSAFHTLYT